MKKNIFYLAVIAIIPLFWNGQNDSRSITITQSDTNLIANPNFEYNQTITVDSAGQENSYSIGEITNDTGWNFSYPLNNPIYIQDAPPGGAYSWSLGLIPVEFLKLDNADYYVTGINGNNNYTLTLWWKIAKKNRLVLVNGSITVGVYNNNGTIISQSHTDSISSQDTLWTHDSLTFSLNTTSSDSIIVRLSGGTTIPTSHAQADGLFLFNEIQLTKH